MMNAVLMLHHPAWQPGQAEMAAGGGADRRSAQIADAPINQSREAHRSARPLLSPERAMHSEALPNPTPTGWLSRHPSKPRDCHRASTVTCSRR